MYLKVICQSFESVNSINLLSNQNPVHENESRGRKQNPLARRAVLGCLHQGLGHSHYEGLVAAMNVQPVAASTYKRAEREVGRVIEETTSESCAKWLEDEKRLSTDGRVKVSFDQGWQK